MKTIVQNVGRQESKRVSRRNRPAGPHYKWIVLSNTTLGTTLSTGLTKSGLPAVVATKIAHLPPTSALFAAFLGYNPMATLVPSDVLQALPAAKRITLLGHSFFPNPISPPFSQGLHNVFYLSAAMCLVAAFVSMLRGKQKAISQKVMSENGSVDNVSLYNPAQNSHRDREDR